MTQAVRGGGVQQRHCERPLSTAGHRRCLDPRQFATRSLTACLLSCVFCLRCRCRPGDKKDQKKGEKVESGPALAICLSGGYEDDDDHGDWFWYTGEGGRNTQGVQVGGRVTGWLGWAAECAACVWHRQNSQAYFH